MVEAIARMLKSYDMVSPGETVICAVSGGADSVALLFGMYLLREKLGVSLEAAHFNHGLRGEESDRDEAFVRQLCDRLEIPLHLGRGRVTAGKKGLEAAARDARYGFFESLPGKIATAHTADDNLETVLMHLIRGTGLKGLGGIAPVRGRYIRPMLTVTRHRVEAFLEEYHLSFVTDSSNESDGFLRNRLRHHTVPLLKRENPRLAENVSRMALDLRQDEEALREPVDLEKGLDCGWVRTLPAARRRRVLAQSLERWGVREPEREHIALAESLVASGNPSAMGHFPGGVVLRRQYGALMKEEDGPSFAPVALKIPGVTEIPALGLQVRCTEGRGENGPWVFTVDPQGEVVLGPRQTGDAITLKGGTKSLKKLFIDRKVPLHQRSRVPVLRDEKGVLAVGGLGVHEGRRGTAVTLEIIKREDAGQ